MLDIIAPPYSDEFVDLFLPVVQNEEITGSLRNAEKSDDVSIFIGKMAVEKFICLHEATINFSMLFYILAHCSQHH